MNKKVNTLKNLLMLSSRQRNLCTRLEAGRSRLFRMAYAWSHCTDTADEVVQEAMIKAFNSVDKVKDANALDGWLFRILSNCFIDHCRKKRSEINIDDVVLIEKNTPETIHGKNEMLTTVRSAIGNLPFKHRQVITLIDIENFSYAEVAEIIDAPPGTVMSRLNRARKSLRQILNTSPVNEVKTTKLKIVP
jgi:RNA polymerase sigma-70 factor, ECF subfamily